MQRMVTWRADALDCILLRELQKIEPRRTVAEVLRDCVKQAVIRETQISQEIRVLIEEFGTQDVAVETPPALFDQADARATFAGTAASVAMQEAITQVIEDNGQEQAPAHNRQLWEEPTGKKKKAEQARARRAKKSKEREEGKRTANKKAHAK